MSAVFGVGPPTLAQLVGLVLLVGATQAALVSGVTVLDAAVRERTADAVLDAGLAPGTSVETGERGRHIPFVESVPAVGRWWPLVLVGLTALLSVAAGLALVVVG